MLTIYKYIFIFVQKLITNFKSNENEKLKIRRNKKENKKYQ